MNAKYPATIGGCNCHLGGELIEAIQMALGKAMPETVSAMWAPHVSFVTFGDDGREFDEEAGDYRKYYFTFFGPDGGSGAIWGYDGWPHVTPPIIAGGVTKNTAEITEIMTPWRILQYGYLKDSAGAATSSTHAWLSSPISNFFNFQSFVKCRSTVPQPSLYRNSLTSLYSPSQSHSSSSW